jgi:hypothetical protein
MGFNVLFTFQLRLVMKLPTFKSDQKKAMLLHLLLPPSGINSQGPAEASLSASSAHARAFALLHPVWPRQRDVVPSRRWTRRPPSFVLFLVWLLEMPHQPGARDIDRRGHGVGDQSHWYGYVDLETRVISSRCRHLVCLFLPVLSRPVTAPRWRCRACCMRRPLGPKMIYRIRTSCLSVV